MVDIRTPFLDFFLKEARKGDLDAARKLYSLLAVCLNEKGKVDHPAALAFLVEVLEQIGQGKDPNATLLLKRPRHRSRNDFATELHWAHAIHHYLKQGVCKSLAEACRRVKEEEKINKTERALANLYNEMLPALNAQYQE